MMGRHLFRNFVPSSRERINQAKEDWRMGRFGKVTGDEGESIPLPEGRVTVQVESRDAQVSTGSPAS